MAPGALLARVVEQTLSDILPDRLRPVETNGVSLLNLDDAGATPAGHPQQAALDFRKRPLSHLGAGRAGARILEQRIPIFGRKRRIRSCSRRGRPSGHRQQVGGGISGHLYFRTYRTSCRCHSAPAWNCRTRCTSRFSSISPRRAGFGPSYTSRFSVGENRCSGSAIFSAVAASPWPRRAVGPEEGDRGEVAKSAVQIQRNARRSRPCMPDTQFAGLVRSDTGS
jgi:hypothetical protein